MINLENPWHDQFIMGFTTLTEFKSQIPETTLAPPGASKTLLATAFKRCSITKIDIKFNEQSIFEDRPLEWGSDTTTQKGKMIEDRANRRLLKMQMDYWGCEGNPMCHNSCIQRPKDIPQGQKWAWIPLNPNFNGGAEHIQHFNTFPEIIVWGDEAYQNARWTMNRILEDPGNVDVFTKLVHHRRLVLFVTQQVLYLRRCQALALCSNSSGFFLFQFST